MFGGVGSRWVGLAGDRAAEILDEAGFIRELALCGVTGRQRAVLVTVTG